MSAARRSRAAGGPFAGGVRLVRAAAVGALVAVLAVSVAGCSRDTEKSAQRRRDVDEAVARRGAGDRVADTASLVTPVRGDSLIGAARGVGGEATVRAACATCHEGAHAAQLGRGEGPSLLCIDCHASSHEPVQAFYAGALRSVSVPADTMFVARVSCVGCHSDTTFAAPAGAARKAALDAMCTSCHGRRFGGMLAMWASGVEWRAQAVTAYVGQAAADARLSGEPSRSRVRVARDALQLLRTVGALHNVRGADQLFRAALDSTVAAYRRAGVAAPDRPALGPDPVNNACLGCHYGVESARGTIFGQTFDHASHVVRADVACKDCHSEAMYFAGGKRGASDQDRALDTRHGKTTITAASCDNCHHSPTTKVGCTSCHVGDERLKKSIRVVMALKLKPEKSPTSRPVAFLHAQHEKATCERCHTAPGSVRDIASCASCHTDHHKERASGCASCHGSTMLATHTMDTHFKCANCHEKETLAKLLPDRAFCVSCHVKQVTHEPGRECAPCHLHLSPSEVRRRMLAAEAARPGARK